MTLVLDASMAFGWYVADEASEASDLVLDRVAESGAVVPTLWRLEVANGFRTAIRRGRCDARLRDRALAALAALPITEDPETSAAAWDATLLLSDRFGLSVYDAAYLELAQRRRMPLATRDARLAEAAVALGFGVVT